MLLDVESASRRMRRYYCTIKETMRAMAGYLPKMKNWPAKKMLARHIWLDATHADLVRSRALDLRYPRIDVDDQSDHHLTRFLNGLPLCASDEQFLISVYQVVKPDVLTSLKQYISQSDELDDAPSHVYLNRIIAELEQELSEFQKLEEAEWNGNTEINSWRHTMKDVLQQCGGVDGPDLECNDFWSGEAYEIPMEGGRDNAWEPAVMQVPPRAPKNWVEHQIWIAIDHANEVWASETAASVIWQYRKKPWKLYLNAARWCYDEMRHAMMGEQRLHAMGLQIGQDYPMVADHWKAFRDQGLPALVLLLHGLEQKGPLHKSKLKKELFDKHDFEGAQDCDYDWADESNHISFGLEWIKAIYPDWSKTRIIDETNRLVDEWKEWMKKHHQNGTHGYDKFMSRIESRAAQIRSSEDGASGTFVPTHFSEK